MARMWLHGWVRLLAAGWLWVAAAQGVFAQELATLVADRVSLAADATLVADGNVEVFFGTTRLRASRISFDRATEGLQITGPIVITQADGTVITAEQADLSADLRNGILKGARLVLNQQLQLAAAQIDRVDGRYLQMSRTVASSCRVCAKNPVPLWEIRAARVVHDQVERQIYFDNAQFRVGGVPLAFFPRLRIPDPSLKRATGFLMPKFRSTSTLGAGIKLPYFIKLNDSRDLLVTPYLSVNATQTVELRYRQALRAGSLEFRGALSSDTLIPGQMRGYLFGEGQIAIGDGYLLQFGLQSVSDAAYLLDYGQGTTDRLRSFVGVTRTRANSYLNAQVLKFQSIREGEDNTTLPGLVGDFTLHRRFTPAILGGEGGFQVQAYTLHRTSRVDQAGRDAARASLQADWRRNWILPLGLTGSALATVRADAYWIGQDSRFAHTILQATPAVALELRWPWSRTGPSGAHQVIEPVAQLVFSPKKGGAVPNEDSTLVEFDEGNLFAFNRFPGADATERGLRGNLGLSYTRYDPAGWSAGLTVGRVVRLEDVGQFGIGSGLAGRLSDWLASAQLQGNGWTLTDRVLLDPDLSVTRNELRLAVQRGRLGLTTSHLWLESDVVQARPLDTSEWAMAASYALNSGWTGRINWLYDHVADRGTSAGVGLQYRGDCVTLDLSFARRFTSSTSVTPTTDFGLSVDLAGFGGAAQTGAARRVCR